MELNNPVCRPKHNPVLMALSNIIMFGAAYLILRLYTRFFIVYGLMFVFVILSALVNIPLLGLLFVGLRILLSIVLFVFVIIDTYIQTKKIVDGKILAQPKKEGLTILGVITIIVFIIALKMLGKTKHGKYAFDWIKYNMPLFGPIIAKTSISRFARTLGTLMASGVGVLSALVIVKDTAGNDVVSNAVAKVHDAVKEGEGIAPPLGATKIFPEMVVSMIEVGEETGKLPDMLEKVADTYEEEVDNAVGALTSLIEPLMIVGLAVVVGTIVIALFMPLTKIIEKLG